MQNNSKTTGLVLSGGGHKGIAHAGVLHFLEEKQIKIDQIAGTSAGSIVSCLYSGGMRPLEILEFFKSVNLFNWQHFTLKKAGIMDVSSFKKYLFKVFQDRTIGDLQIPVFITATNMLSGRLHIFNEKVKVIDAILASSAFPGVFSPHMVNGKLYSDGGILNNFPTNIIQGHCDFIIGVNVCPMQEINENDLNSIRSVTVRAYELMSTLNNHQKGELCDWLIEPKALTNYATFERNRSRMDEIFELGYTTAKETFKDKTFNFEKAVL